jgi:hypothetical protein
VVPEIAITRQSKANVHIVEVGTNCDFPFAAKLLGVTSVNRGKARVKWAGSV